MRSKSLLTLIVIALALIMFLTACAPVATVVPTEIPESTTDAVILPIKTPTVTESVQPTAELATTPTAAPQQTSSSIGTVPVPTAAPTEQPQPSPTSTLMPEPTEEVGSTCTVQILCYTVLDNMDKLDPAKEEYIPDDGVILDIDWNFEPGASVYDVLSEACRANGIHAEFEYTPIYNTYYIRGINHLYEFDCGTMSGWQLRFNGEFPQSGISTIQVEEGDHIELLYTCEYGRDLI